MLIPLLWATVARQEDHSPSPARNVLCTGLLNGTSWELRQVPGYVPPPCRTQTAYKNTQFSEIFKQIN